MAKTSEKKLMTWALLSNAISFKGAGPAPAPCRVQAPDDHCKIIKRGPECVTRPLKDTGQDQGGRQRRNTIAGEIRILAKPTNKRETWKAINNSDTKRAGTDFLCSGPFPFHNNILFSKHYFKAL